MLITMYDSYNILTKVYSQGAFLKQAIQDTQIEPLNRAKVTKICYGVLEKDVTLSYIISTLCDKQPKLAVRTILKIALYLIVYMNKTPYSVTDNAVELLKKLGKGGMKGFLNAVLRNYIRNGYPMPKGELDYLSVKYSYPKYVVEILIKDYGKQVAENIMQEYNERTCVRFNDNINGEEYLKNLQFSYEKTPFENVFFVDGFKMEEGFYNGDYTFQSIGSVAICDSVEKGESLLDVCSAPGGKTVNLTSKFSSVTATELHEHRLELLKSYCSRMNKTNVTCLCKDMKQFYEPFKDKFDAVLLDAPCSGFGVVKDNPDIFLNRKKEDLSSIINEQFSLLSTACKYVKKGGYLYYSTCSILKDENVRQIAKFLAKFDNFKEEKTVSKLPCENQEFGVQFLPYLSNGAGFYFVKLKRIK